MKVLFLCNKSPFPPREGAPLAINANIRCLVDAGHKVKVLAMNTNKYFVNSGEIPESFKKETDIELVYIDLTVKPLAAFRNLFSKRSLHVERFISKQFSDKLKRILEADNYDIVQLETLYMTPYVDVIRNNSNVKIVLRSHNIEHLIWERVAATTANPLKKTYLKYLAAKLRKYEIDKLNTYDGIMTISAKDADYFSANGVRIPVDTVPFGIDPDAYKSMNQQAEFPSLFHIGSMNWMPNEEGIHWFLENVWPFVHDEIPDLKLYLAGRAMPDWLLNLKYPNVEICGEVPDAREFMLTKGVMIVPLFSGSGIRIKIIEGMALGKPIIATAIGAEGVRYTNGENIIIANNPADFLQAVKQCCSDKKFCESLGVNAKSLIEKEHNLKLVLKKLEGFYKKIM